MKPSEETPASPTKTLRTPVSRLAQGSLFAERYQIIEELGKGGMGEVYRVKDRKLDEEMALKLLKPEIAADKDTIERFKNELKLARKIAHRNEPAFFRIKDLITDLVMENGKKKVKDEKMAGDPGFESVTSTVCKRRKFWSQFLSLSPSFSSPTHGIYHCNNLSFMIS